ncbi:13493_t:CDS:2, partial [Dentiscutata heterogama]
MEAFNVGIINTQQITSLALDCIISKFENLKTVWNNIPIKRNINLDPIKGFLILMFLHGTFRTISLLIATKDLFPDNYIIKSVISALGWAFGCFAIATYLFSIFKVLPRLALNQHSVFSIDADLPEDHLTANRFIPNPNSMLKVYWTYTITTFVLTLILSILRGYFQGTGENTPFDITHTLLGVGLGISDVLGIVCFMKYGRLVIKLLEESATLIGLMDIRNSQRKTLCLEDYRIHLKKLKIINFSLLVTVGWFGFLGFFAALMRRTIEKYMIWYIIIAAISLDGTTMLILITLLVIIYG